MGSYFNILFVTSLCCELFYVLITYHFWSIVCHDNFTQNYLLTYASQVALVQKQAISSLLVHLQKRIIFSCVFHNIIFQNLFCSHSRSCQVVHEWQQIDLLVEDSHQISFHCVQQIIAKPAVCQLLLLIAYTSIDLIQYHCRQYFPLTLDHLVMGCF